MAWPRTGCLKPRPRFAWLGPPSRHISAALLSHRFHSHYIITPSHGRYIHHTPGEYNLTLQAAPQLEVLAFLPKSLYSLPRCMLQSSDGVSDDALVRKVLAPAGLEAPDDATLNSSADDVHPATVPTDNSTTNRLFASTFANKPVNPAIKVSRRSKNGKTSSSSGALAAAPASRQPPSSFSKPARKPGAPGGRGARERFLSDDEVPGTGASSSSGGGSGSRGGGFPVGVASSKPVPMAGLVEVDLEDASSGRPSGPVGGRRDTGDSGPIDGPSLLLDAAARDAQGMESEERGRESADYDDHHDDGREGVSSTVGTVGTDAVAGGLAAQSPTGDEILLTLRTMEVTKTLRRFSACVGCADLRGGFVAGAEWVAVL